MQTATDSLTTKREAYLAARTAFKRHEAWGWHVVAPLAEGASEEEKATIQAGVDRYEELRAELKRAKRRYKKARHAANRAASASASGSASSETSETTETASVVEEVVEVEAPQPKPYHELVKDKWQAENSNFYTALRKFRRFHAKDGKATFMVAKDGANYEDMSLKVEELLVPGLRLWASILQVPYASRMVRAELESVLQPVLDVLVRGPVPNRWIYL